MAKKMYKNAMKNGLEIKWTLNAQNELNVIYDYLEENNIDAYIPNFGQYKPEREGFIYNNRPQYLQRILRPYAQEADRA